MGIILPKIKCVECGEEREVLPQHETTIKRCEVCAFRKLKKYNALKQREHRARVKQAKLEDQQIIDDKISQDNFN